jgi:ubiquinone/menaquinone biosynthesis C-methylase UbiE/uncharacterized protein YbaR (Trm112 family)
MTATPQTGALYDQLVCPACLGSLHWGRQISCEQCDSRYPETEGIPVLRGDIDEHKQQQAAYHDDEVDAEFEIERPWCLPAFMRWLLIRKLERTVRGLQLQDATALTVCGGSGMDAEFLARGGARVFSADISLGAAQRARERALRRSLAIIPVVADAERLPFADRSIDLVYVHDGLHHLAEPLQGLREMVRVARTAVAVNEPARATVTELAIRLRLSERVEDAGNYVARLHPDSIVRELVHDGRFVISRYDRYPMYYKKSLLPVFRLLSMRPIMPIARVGQMTAERIVNEAGNKLTIHATRSVR